ncbi:MAG: KdsC family phosphatase [Gemmataceae bacterium]
MTTSPAPRQTLKERCASIDLLVLDVDGVLTDGRIIYADNDVEIKSFFVRDGSGLKIWSQAGKRAAIITGRTSSLVQARAAELDIDPLVQGASAKLPALADVLQRCQLPAARVCYIGDDLPDVPALRACGLAVAVADACPEVKDVAHYVTQAPGGRGAVRETIEMILGCQGKWSQIVAEFHREKLGAG